MKLMVPASRRLARSLSTTTKHPSWFLRMVDNNDYDLPRLPVPQLNETLERYLRSVQPLVSAAEYKEHKKLVEDFGLGANRSVGRQLQDELFKQEFVNVMGRAYPFSYIEAWWDKMYLGGRYPNPINVNPGYGLVDEAPGSVLADPLVRTSKFVTSLLKWFQKVKAGELEQDPKQCMSSLAKQLGTAKIPQTGCDALAFHPTSTHIVVLKDNAFYKVQVLDARGKDVVSPASLEAQLARIMQTKVSDAPNIAALTAEDRDTWASVRATLIADDATNKASIEAIDSALLVLVLDEKSYSGSELTAMTLHGNGSNRWFDKHQVLMYGDGHLAVNFEHTFSDGTAWNRWLHETWHDMRQSDSGFSPLTATTTFAAPAAEALAWSLSPTIHQAIATAGQVSAKDIGNTDSHLLSFDGFGKNTIKNWGMSPDGAVQMAYQLAYFRQHGHVAPTYESCSTRAFFHGRTETIRSATSEAQRFVSAVTSDASMASQKEFLKKAVDRHVSLAKEAQQGLGCDRHLTMLNDTASKAGIAHDFLSSPVRAKSSHYQLSTSNVTMPFLSYFTFGAVVPSGYGLGYLIQNETIPINITSFKDSNESDSAKFANSISDALATVRSIAESS